MMNPDLKTRIDSLDIRQPWVWQLQLSKSDFAELETEIIQQNNATLISPAWAKRTIAYLAEWYSREYASGKSNQKLDLSSEELKRLWKASGISTKTYVYKNEQGHHRWLYSIYVLGGLSIPHELGRNDGGRFLKALCRIYHGEDYDLDLLDDTERALSFRESIKQEHSLYHYLKAVLQGELNNPLAAAIQNANKEVYRKKFQLEWNIIASTGKPQMIRQLKLHLNPEEVGGGLHQYLRYDRLQLWGFIHPEQTKKIFASIRFKLGEKEIRPLNWACPFIIWYNTGDETTGFLNWKRKKNILDRLIPTDDFDTIEIYIRADDGEPKCVQTFIIEPYIQLWQTNPYYNTWSSCNNPQHPTTLLFAPPCTLEQGESEEKFFIDTNGNQSKPWKWAYIYNKLILLDKAGNIHHFYNRTGYDQIYTQLHHHLLRYEQGGMIRHKYWHDREIDAHETVEYLPLIWSKDDIKVRHFKTKSNLPDLQPETDEAEIESIEYKDGSSYRLWNEEHQPNYGVVRLRITVRGRQTILKLAYLEPLNTEEPLRRDLEHNKIVYAKGEKIDEIRQGQKSIDPTTTIKLQEGGEKFELDVWRATNLKEVVVDGKVICRTNENVRLPYILKERTTYNDFSKTGYQSFDCSHLSSIYQVKYNRRGAAMEAWKTHQATPARELAPHAPKSLYICIGTSGVAASPRLEYYRWDYHKEHLPERVESIRPTEENIIYFQSMKEVDKSLRNDYPHTDADPFSWEDDVEPYLDLINCFELAIEHQLYFFILEPFEDINNAADIREQLVKPLLEKRNGKLTDRDIAGLKRLADEKQIDISEIEFDEIKCDIKRQAI